MTLRFFEPPPEDRNVALDGLHALSRSGAMSSPTVKRIATEKLQLSRPLPVYTLGLDQLRGRDPLSGARQTGWRYTVEADEQVLALTETVTDERGQQAFGSVNYGPFVQGTDRALRTQMQRTDVEAAVRLLTIPALYLVALLLDQEGAPPILVPVAPAPPGIDSNRSYDADDLLELLRTRAGELEPLTATDDRGT